MEIIIKNVRGAFLNAHSVGVYEGKASYGAQLIIAPNDPQIANIEKALLAVAKDKWKAEAQQVYDMLKAQDRLCFRRHPKLDKQGKPYDGFEGNFYLACSSRENQKPLCLNADKTIANDGTIYGGCYIDVKLSLWPQDNNFGRRINAQPLVFQFRAPGDAFAGGPPPSADGMDDLSDVGETADSMYD